MTETKDKFEIEQAVIGSPLGKAIYRKLLDIEHVKGWSYWQLTLDLHAIATESNRKHGLELLEKVEAAKCESLDKSDPSLWGEEYTASNRHHTQLFNDGVDKTIQVIKSQIEKEPKPIVEQCFCKSYYDEKNMLRDCTCGKCV